MFPSHPLYIFVKPNNNAFLAVLHKKPLEKLSPVLTILVPPTLFVSYNKGRPLGFIFTNYSELTEIQKTVGTHVAPPLSAWLSLQQLSDK